MAFQGPGQPSPTLGDALNAGYLYLEVKCLGCDTHQTVALDIVRRRKASALLLRSRASSFLEHGLDLPHRPAFAGGYHAHARLSAHQDMGADLVLNGNDAEIGLGFPVQRQIEVAREYLPPRPVIEFDDVAFRMRSDLHPRPVIRSIDFRRVSPETTSLCSSNWPVAISQKMCSVSALRAWTRLA
jgi:hypothetical protein